MLFQYTHSFHTIFFYILSFLQSASYPFLYHLLLYSLMLTGRFAPLFIPSSFIFYHAYRALRTPFYTIFFYILSFSQGASHPILYHLLLFSIMLTGRFTSLLTPSSFIFCHAYRALHTPFYTIFFYILSFLQGASHPILYHLLLYSIMPTGRFTSLFIPSSFIFYHAYRALRTPFYTIFFYILSWLQGASHPFLYHLLLYSIMLTGRFTPLFIPSSFIFSHSYRVLHIPFYTIFYYILSCLQGTSHPFFIPSSFIYYHSYRALHIPFLYYLLLYAIMLTGRFTSLFLPFPFIFYHAYRALRTPSYTIFFYNLSCLHGASNTFYLNNLAF